MIHDFPQNVNTGTTKLSSVSFSSNAYLVLLLVLGCILRMTARPMKRIVTNTVKKVAQKINQLPLEDKRTTCQCFFDMFSNNLYQPQVYQIMNLILIC